MKIGLIMFALGLLLLGCAYISYLRTARQLEQTKKEDLVSYYLDLVWHLFPMAFWSGVIGAVSIIVAVIVILVHIPLVF